MYNEASTKKKRIILSTNRKSSAKCSSSTKEFIDQPTQENNQEINNCISSINNSLEIFEDDPKNRHFHFLEDQRQETGRQNKARILNYESSQNYAPQHLFCKKSSRFHLQKENKEQPLVFQNDSCTFLRVKKIRTSPNRKYIDLTLKSSKSKVLGSNKSSTSFCTSKHQQTSCTLQNEESRSTQRSIFSSVSVNSLHFTVVNRPTSERKKQSLTITCHKYKQDVKIKKTMQINGINKYSSIKLFKKCI